MDSILATFEANDVTRILLVLSSIILRRLSLTSDSEPALPGLKILVESQIMAETPFFPMDFNFCSSNSLFAKFLSLKKISELSHLHTHEFFLASLYLVFHLKILKEIVDC